MMLAALLIIGRNMTGLRHFSTCGKKYEKFACGIFATLSVEGVEIIGEEVL